MSADPTIGEVTVIEEAEIGLRRPGSNAPLAIQIGREENYATHHVGHIGNEGVQVFAFVGGTSLERWRHGEDWREKK